MVKEVWHLLQLSVTWLTRVVLAWQWSVTTVKAGHMCIRSVVMAVEVVTRVTFITQERVSLSWRVSPESLHTVNSLSNMSVIIRYCSTTTIHTDGGCHVTLKRWGTGAEHLPIINAHAEWPTHVQNPDLVVTVIKTIMCGVKTVVFSLIRPNFQLNSSGLEILITIDRLVTTLLGSWSVMA